MEQITIFKKREIRAKDTFAFALLQQRNEFLIPLYIKNQKEELEFHYEIPQHMVAFQSIYKKDELSKWRALRNISKLSFLSKNYQIDLRPSNLQMDENLISSLQFRDVKDELEDIDFITQYKALIGRVMLSKHKFDEFLNGSDLVVNSKKLAGLDECNSVEDITAFIDQKINECKERFEQNYIIVSKKQYDFLLRFLFVRIVVFALFISFSIYQTFMYLPRIQASYEASLLYIQEEYVEVLGKMSSVRVSRMNKNTKYIVALSVIHLEPLSEKQKQNILKDITNISDPRIFDYWIYLSKDQYKDAIDMAKQMGSDDYILYAYVKEKTFIESDGSLSGEERERKIEDVHKEIEKYKEELFSENKNE